jgi:hypothetical protein
MGTGHRVIDADVAEKDCWFPRKHAKGFSPGSGDHHHLMGQHRRRKNQSVTKMDERCLRKTGDSSLVLW